MAYTRNLNNEDNLEDSHQTSPGYVLTFTRWRNRDTLNYIAEGNSTTRRPLVVVNDATQVSVELSKTSPCPAFSCTLKNGDLNYLTAVSPGDFVVVNMLNWESKAMEIRERALISQAVNRYGDGFKGVFKITDVRLNLTTNINGVKQYTVSITGKGFDEFNSTLYFNPAVVVANQKASPTFFLSQFDSSFKKLLQTKDSSNIQELVKSIIKKTIGTGTKSSSKGPVPNDKIPRYLMPPQVGKLLNRKKGKIYTSDLNNYYIGIWNPSKIKTSSSASVLPKDGFSGFFNKTNDGNFFDTTVGYEIPGSRLLAVQDFQNVKVWSLLQNYSNTVLNETYTTYRVAPDGYVYPSVVVRQKPFSTRHYMNNPSKTKHTQFLDLPRWKISPNLITAISLGRSEAARINFVQIFTRSLSIDENFNQAIQISKGNYVADEKDIERCGMRPYIATCNFDYPSAKQDIRGNEWANLVADWVINGHLKMNGSIQSIGIQQPISIGDNLEFDGIVYQIESVSHNIGISPEGFKIFRTSVSLSMGISESSTSAVPVYAEMDHTDAFKKRKEDYKREGVLPGFSDTQDLPGRSKGEETKETEQATFTNPKPKR